MVLPSKFVGCQELYKVIVLLLGQGCEHIGFMFEIVILPGMESFESDREIFVLELVRLIQN